jgi:PHD/YefM family antitoxin component YafN of YafNO toxin-antitoxin module
MTNRHPMETVPLTRARADLGPLARWVGSTQSRIALSSRGRVAAILISPVELAELDEAARGPAAPPGPPPAAHSPRAHRQGPLPR